MSSKRRQFSAQEKQRVALEAVRGEVTLAEISAKYKIHATQINKWKKELLTHIKTAFVKKPNLIKEEYEDQMKTLYQQIGQLKVENDFLKKKSDVLSD